MSKPQFPWCRSLRTYYVYDASYKKVLSTHRFKKEAAKHIPAKRKDACVIVEMRGTYIVPRKVKP